MVFGWNYSGFMITDQFGSVFPASPAPCDPHHDCRAPRWMR